MRLCQTAFGLRFSCNRTVPGLQALPEPCRPDTRIRLGQARTPEARETAGRLWYRSGSPEGVPSLTVWTLDRGSRFRFRYTDGVEFLIDRAGSDVSVSWPSSSSLEDAATYLLGPVLGFILRLRGVTCLHASAVAAGDRAIALLGPPCAGKSTLAACFGRLGHAILSDDVTALVEDGPTLRVQPAYPQLRLWPDAVRHLYGTPDALPRLTPNWDKRALDLMTTGGSFETRVLPLAAVYVLGARSAESAPRVEPLRGRERLLALLANTYVGYLLDRDMRERELDVLARLAGSVPVRRLIAPADGSALEAVCRQVLTDFSTA